MTSRSEGPFEEGSDVVEPALSETTDQSRPNHMLLADLPDDEQIRDLADLLDDELIRDACARFERNKDTDKKYIDCLLKLCNWLANSKPPAATGWTGQRGNARKFKGGMAVPPIQNLAVNMINGQWWRKQLVGWTQFAACMLAILHMSKNKVHLEKIDKIVAACVDEKDKMYQSLLKRHLEGWTALTADGPPPTLLDVKAAKHLDYGESKWKSIQSYFEEHFEYTEEAEDNCRDPTVMKVVDAAFVELLYCVSTETPPREVVAMLKHLHTPPGFKSLADVQERERVQRAKDAEHDDFDLESSPEDEVPREEANPSGSRTSTPSPVLLIAPPEQLLAKKRAREDDGPSEEMAPGNSDDRMQAKYKKLVDMRDNIRGLVKCYGKLLHSFEYAGGNLDRNIVFAYGDVNPFANIAQG